MKKKLTVPQEVSSNFDSSLISFVPEVHLYLAGGMVVPSVTQVTSWVVQKDYSEVPAGILNAKADYGNRIHEWIETYSLTREVLDQSELMKITTDQWILAEEENHIDIESCEHIISYRDRYAGTYDMLGYMNGWRTLFDIKTTAKYDEEYLSIQLGMYKLALEEAGDKIDKCICIWCPKGKLLQLLEVDVKSAEEINKLIDKYEASLLEDLPF